MNRETFFFTVNFKNVRSYFDIHKALFDGLELPDYYGANLDALWDCLTDMVMDEVHIDLNNYDDLEKLDRDYSIKMLNVFKNFKHCYNNKYTDLITIRIFRGEEMEEIQ